MKTNTSVSLRNVALYKWFMPFSEPLFWGPILIQTLMNLGKMTLPEIYYMESIVIIILIVLNIPAGSLADVIGRKKTLIIGQFFLLASCIGFAFMSTPWQAWFANVLWAIGFSFQNSSLRALIYNTLKNHGCEKSYAEICGCANGYRFITAAICALAVSPLAIINLRLPLYLCIPFLVIPLVVSFFFIEERTTEKYEASKQIKVIKDAVIMVCKTPQLWWIIGFVSLIGGASKLWFFTYNPYFEGVGIELKYYGYVFCCLNLVAWYFCRNAAKIETHLSERICVIAMILCIGIPILLMGLFPLGFMVSMVLVQNVVRGFMTPFTDNYVNKHIDSEGVRATVLSAKSTFTDSFASLALIGFGLVNSNLGLFESLIILGVTVLVLGFFSYLQYQRLFLKTKLVSGSK